jgi:hypothetical protein
VINLFVIINKKHSSFNGKRQWKTAIEKMIEDVVIQRQIGQNGRPYVQAYDISLETKKFCKIIKGAIVSLKW